MKITLTKLEILCIICIILVGLAYHKEIKNMLMTPVTNPAPTHESFQNNSGTTADYTGVINDTPEVKYEYDAQSTDEFPATIFESSVNTMFGASYPIMVCNLLPTKKSRDCMINGEPIVKYKFPVHIIKLTNGKHLAVFNDGRLYLKDKLTDKMWQGPIKNSLPNRDIPLRMVTMDPSGTKLVAVGYDNKAYTKYSGSGGDKSGSLELETEWQPLIGLDNIIFLMYHYDPATDKNRYIIIDTVGKIKITQNDKPDSGLVDYGVLKEPILKLCYSAEGYMLAIDTKFKLRTFDEKEWGSSQFSTKYTGNNTPLLDVLYDKDQLLFGCVILPKAGVAEIMKQESPDFMAPFVPFELNKYLTGGIESKLTDRFIIFTKMGIYTNQGLLEEEALDDDINMAYQRQMLLDKKRLREFCAARGIKADDTYRNYEVLRQVDGNKQKIDRLNNIIAQLISFDPDQKQIQESIIGVNFIRDARNKSALD